MSLADELLADLEEGGSEEDELGDEGQDMKEEMEELVEEEEDTADYARVGSIAKLRDSARFKKLMQGIEEGLATERAPLKGPAEADPEYALIVEANNVSADIDNEIATIHKFTKDKYGKRFPELDSLVSSPLEYMALAAEMGNNVLEKAGDKDFLSSILLPATVIVVSVTATTTQGTPLEADELEAVREACQMARELQDAKVRLFQFVESRMGMVAPNLSACVGAGVAARLMGVAGGVSELAKMPACNILVLGAQKRTLTGFSSTAVQPHAGFIFFSPLVQGLPPDHRKKAARLIAAKATLAARVDAIHSSPEGTAGQELLDEIQSKIQKMLEPPPVKKVKALPKPLDISSKKRGGRRARKTKERLGLTELRKRANRINFAEIEEDVTQTSIGFGLGQIKKGGTGNSIRAAQVDNKSRVRMSKILAKQIGRANAVGGGGATVVRAVGMGGGGAGAKSARTVAGTASSVSFTPVQGLEILNPNAAEASASSTSSAVDSSLKYFANTASFIKVQTPLPGSSKDAP